MTDARFPERWLNDKRIIRLDDAAFRTFVLGMTWAVANRTDGYVDRDDLNLVHGADPAKADDLIKAGLWSEADDAGCWIEGFTLVQTPSGKLDGLDQRRANDARRSKRYRDRKKDSEPEPDPTPSSSRSSRDESRDDIGQDRTGQAKDRTGAFTGKEVEGDVTRDSATTSSSEASFGTTDRALPPACWEHGLGRIPQVCDECASIEAAIKEQAA